MKFLESDQLIHPMFLDVPQLAQPASFINVLLIQQHFMNINICQAESSSYLFTPAGSEHYKQQDGGLKDGSHQHSRPNPSDPELKFET